jgi:hypothetical protein
MSGLQNGGAAGGKDTRHAVFTHAFPRFENVPIAATASRRRYGASSAPTPEEGMNRQIGSPEWRISRPSCGDEALLRSLFVVLR